MKISKHARMRMIERTNLNHKERRTLFREALDNGKSIQDVKDNKIKGFLISKKNNCNIKLYKDYVFIYSKNSKQLYTLYRLPSELLERNT